MQVRVPFTELLILKELLMQKRSLNEVETMAFIAKCNTLLENHFPPKLKHLGSFSILCNIDTIFSDKALYDLGASVSVMSIFICKQLTWVA